jgi:two-component system sensor histidine kinase UhpB
MFSYKTIPLVILLGICAPAVAQTSLIVKSKELFVAGEAKWFERKLPEAKAFFWEYLRQVKAPNDTNDLVNVNDLMANVYLTLGQYDSALYYSSAAFSAISKIKSKRFWGNLNQTKGRILLQLGDVLTAIKCIHIADSFYVASTEKILHDIAPYTAMALGSIYQELKQMDKAAEYYELALARTKGSTEQVEMNCLESLGFFYIASKQYAKAGDAFHQVLSRYKKNEINPTRLYTYLGMGQVQHINKHFDSSMHYYRLCLKICLQQQELYQVDAIYVKMGAAFFQAGKYKEAAVYADSALLWLARTNNVHIAVQACDILAESALKQQQFDKAVRYLRKKEAYTDSMLTMKNLEVSNNLYILNKVRQKDEAIALLNKSDQVNKGLIKRGGIITYLLLGIVCLSVLFFAIYQNRMKLKKQLEKQIAVAQERERIITDLHDDVGATLSSMHIYANLAENVWHSQPVASKEMVGKITQQAKDLMGRMGDIIWSMKPATEEKYTLTLRLTNFSNELLAPKNIQCDFNIDEAIVSNIHNPELRKNVLLIAKEAMNNISKYSDATHAAVSFKQDGNTVTLTVSDNGKGYNVGQVSSGNGLKNIRQRCKQFNGAAEMISSPGNGVIIKCVFPAAVFSEGL